MDAAHAQKSIVIMMMKISKGENNMPNFIMLVGIPAVGKDTWRANMLRSVLILLFILLMIFVKNCMAMLLVRNLPLKFLN